VSTLFAPSSNAPLPLRLSVELILGSFAYVDFATQDAKLEAIALSERNLEGRRLLIKDGDGLRSLSPLSWLIRGQLAEDFSGRPTAATTITNEDGTTTAITTSIPGAPNTSLTKAAQRILAAQKQPPGPTIFFGNLGFQATEDSIRQLLEAHRKKPVKTPVENGGDLYDEEEDSESKVTSKGKELRKGDQWIRKIRMGTFEDSGKCKGCVSSSSLITLKTLMMDVKMASGGRSSTSHRQNTPHLHS
jgi:hypothetical protein